MQETQIFIVATPIGNKKDLSQRAIETLNSVDLIACEDCRTSSNLLNSFNIGTKLISYHKFNEKQRTEEFFNLLEEGKKIALISDAGTPCISDPGRILVKDFFEKGYKITAIPGASAITTLLSIAPRTTEEFAFAGFFPRNNSQQEKILIKYKNTDTIFYESANRLLDTLNKIKEVRGEDTTISVGRELTKVFEEVKNGKISEIIEYYEQNILKGEIALIVYAEDESENIEEKEIIEKIKKLKKQSFSDKDISKILSSLYDINKNTIKKLALTTEE